MFKTQEAADAGALVSTTLAATSWVAQANELLTLVATIVAIIAGAMAALYHYEGWRQKRGKRP